MILIFKNYMQILDILPNYQHGTNDFTVCEAYENWISIFPV